MKKKMPHRLTLNLSRETIRRLDESKELVLAGACDTTTTPTQLLPPTHDVNCPG